MYEKTIIQYHKKKIKKTLYSNMQASTRKVYETEKCHFCFVVN